jgi:HIRAN domain
MPQPLAEDRIARLTANETLMLLFDVQNEYDRNAIAVRTQDSVLLGYLPAYLSEEVRELVSECPDFRAVVERVNPPPAGVHHRLLGRIEGRWPPGYVPFSSEEFQPVNSAATNLRSWFKSRMALTSRSRSMISTDAVASSVGS